MAPPDVMRGSSSGEREEEFIEETVLDESAFLEPGTYISKNANWRETAIL